MTSIAGWTPGLRAILRGHVLPCGCLAGEYETWSANRMIIVDDVDPRCGIESHRMNTIVYMQSSRALSRHPVDEAASSRQEVFN